MTARTVAVTIALFVCALAPAKAHASMQLGIQQEGMSPTRCSQAHQLGVGWARMMVELRKWRTERARYLATVQRCKASGVRVLVSFTHYHATGSGATVAEFATVAAAAARELGPYVDAWSPINEPNHHAFAPAYGACATTKTLVRTRSVFAGWQRVQRGEYQRLRRAGGGWRFKRAERGRWTKAYRTETIRTPYRAALPAANCSAIVARQVHDAVAAQVKRYDPSALVVLGDTAGPGSEYVSMMLAASSARPVANVLGIHYSSPNSGVRAIASRLRLQVWLTEWGMAPTAQAGFAQALQSIERSGVAVAIYYGGLAADSWRDLRLTPGAVAAVKAWH